MSTATKSTVDRSVVQLLSNPNDTPSRQAGISIETERTHRLYGTSLIAATIILLKLNASTYATACTIFHRLYHRVSLTIFSVWQVVLGSVLLATKIEDGLQQRTIRHIILVVDHLYQKRRGCLESKTKGADNSSNHKVRSMSKLGPVWKEWYEKTLEIENHILRELGFTLYWIPDSHPHKFLWDFLKLLFGLEPLVDIVGAGDEKQGDKVNAKLREQKNAGRKDKREQQHHHDLAQRAWDYCNDSCRLDLCVRFDSELIVSC